MMNRRNFLTTSAVALGGLRRDAQPLVHPLVLSRPQRRQAPVHFLPARLEDDLFRSLARLAVDEATQLGATYADIRLGETQGVYLDHIGGTVLEPMLDLSASRKYGIRVLVDGVWGFAGGAVFTRDHVAQAARQATAHARHQARALSAYALQRVELAPCPPQVGEWTTPITIDPFTVPLVEHAEIMGAWAYAMARSYQGGGMAGLQWLAQTRVFASSEGALLVQRVHRGRPSIRRGMNQAMPNFGLMGGGFESVTDPALVERAKAFVDECGELDRVPVTTALDVGRYPVVLDGSGVAAHIDVVAKALESDRVLGDEADASGTSFLSPPEDILGAPTPLFSPLINVAVTPTATAISSLHWDDEGVPLTAYPLIQDGRVVDYATTRETARAMSGGRPPVLRGGLMVEDNDLDNVPVVCPPEVTMAAHPKGPTFTELVRDLKHGIVVRLGCGANPDPTLLTTWSGSEYMYHVKNGTIAGRVPPNFSFLTRTPKLWKQQVVTVGGPATMEAIAASGSKGMPWQSVSRLVTAPAVLFKDVDLVQLQ